MKAWWEGYDPPDGVGARAPHSKINRPRLQRRCRFSADVETMHLIFGDGRSLPLPLDPFDGIAKPEKGDQERNILIVGAETGAPTIHLATSYALHVSALEPDRRWVRAADEFARDVDGGGHFHVGPVDLANVELNKNHFDLVSSRLLLHRYRFRDAVYQKLERSIRKLGTLSLIQFVAANEADPAELNGKMMSTLEPEAPHLLRLEDEKRMLVESGLRPQVIEDVTPEVLSRLTDIFDRWQMLAEEIAEYDQQSRMLQALLAQVQHWQTRTSLLNNGKLQAVRFLSVKKPNELG